MQQDTTHNPYLGTKMYELLGSPDRSGDIGVEIEVEGENLPVEVAGWDVKAEGSLRGRKGRPVAREGGPDTPREYVLPRPLSVKSVAQRMQSLWVELTRGDGRIVRLTSRASTHLHINMSHRTLHDFLGFLLIYQAIEPMLLRLCGEERNGNLFCVPLYESGDIPHLASRWVKALNAQDIYHLQHYWPRGKYASLNLDPLRTYGSLEVRCFPNTITPADVVKWATWLTNIRELATEADATFNGLMERMSDPRWLIESVFGNDDFTAACAPTPPEQLIAYGVEQAYETWRMIQPLFDYKKQSVYKTQSKAPIRRRLSRTLAGFELAPAVEQVVMNVGDEPIPVEPQQPDLVVDRVADRWAVRQGGV